jgi:hypothetical protein
MAVVERVREPSEAVPRQVGALQSDTLSVGEFLGRLDVLPRHQEPTGLASHAQRALGVGA